MSEFTGGILIQAKDSPHVEQAAASIGQPYLLRDLNAHWLALFPEHMNIRQGTLWQWMCDTSHAFPMLHFEHSGNDGWEYYLMHRGGWVAHAAISYGIDFNMWIHLAEARFPNCRDVIGDIMGCHERVTERLYREVRRSQTYRDRVTAQYTSAHPETFAALGVPEAGIARLREILTPEWYHAHMLGQIIEFKQVLGIVEMEWMSYRYLTKHEKP